MGTYVQKGKSKQSKHPEAQNSNFESIIEIYFDIKCFWIYVKIVFCT